MSNVKVEIIEQRFTDEKGIFKLQEAMKLSGVFAGVCYDKEGYNHLVNEQEDKTLRRVEMTLNNGHHSVYDHISISFNLQNIPKILAMVLNNEHQYSTSEKSARYTPVIRNEESLISEREELLYNKWMEIFQSKIKESYGYIYDDKKIKKLAQENARYLVTVFMPTTLIYTTSLRQINYLASWMSDYINAADLTKPNSFEFKLASAMQEFIDELERLNVLEERLLRNEKCRKLSLFASNLNQVEEYFGNVYSTNYKASFACLAQAQRHRTLDYCLEFLPSNEYYVPPILNDDENLVKEWLKDIDSVKDVYPQGQLVLINEQGKYQDFILKCKERLCSAAQLEIMQSTKATLDKYAKALKEKNNVLKEDIAKYCHGARCTFKDFTCPSDCGFKEGKLLTRRI